jgi:hypothetical protein
MRQNNIIYATQSLKHTHNDWILIIQLSVDGVSSHHYCVNVVFEQLVGRRRNCIVVIEPVCIVVKFIIAPSAKVVYRVWYPRRRIRNI